MQDYSYTDPNGILRVIPGAEMEKIIEEYLNDESAQNEHFLSSNPFLGYSVTSGKDCDELPNSEGEFGFVSSNPIPVNGSFGQMVYLSQLRTSQGSRLLFHRVGSTSSSQAAGIHNPSGMVDIFEVLSFDGSYHGELYLDMYHPRKSRKAPEGFAFHNGLSLISGTHVGVEDFPNNYREIVYMNYRDQFTQLAFELPEVIESVVSSLPKL
jgi:hypothetical protein